MIAARWPRPARRALLLVAQSNAGLPQLVGDHFEYDVRPDDDGRARRARCASLGIDVIGACCGSTPGTWRRLPPRSKADDDLQPDGERQEQREDARAVALARELGPRDATPELSQLSHETVRA